MKRQVAAYCETGEMNVVYKISSYGDNQRDYCATVFRKKEAASSAKELFGEAMACRASIVVLEKMNASKEEMRAADGDEIKSIHAIDKIENLNNSDYPGDWWKIRDLVDHETRKIVEDHFDKIEKVAEVLLEKNEIEGAEFYSLINKKPPGFDKEAYLKVNNKPAPSIDL